MTASRNVCIRLPDRDLKAVHSICEEFGCNASTVLKAALREYEPTEESIKDATAATGTAAMDRETVVRIAKSRRKK